MDNERVADRRACLPASFRLATAYAITKTLLPVRLMFSVWATPGFARAVVIPIRNGLGRLFRRRKVAVGGASAAAGTGAVSGGAIAREAPGTVGSVKSAVEVGGGMEKGVKNPP